MKPEEICPVIGVYTIGIGCPFVGETAGHFVVDDNLQALRTNII